MSLSLLLIESSILIRSIPFEYSPNDSKGMTTSSFILKALVCLAIAAVRALSSQNRFLASEETAIKPSPSFAFAICTVLEAASPTILSSSLAISAIRIILGLIALLALVLYPTAFIYLSSKCSSPARNTLSKLSK